MTRFFSKDFWYNWSPNLENPGLGDYLVFSVKQLFFGLLFIAPFVAVGCGSLGLVIWSGASEEQARVTWMVNARRPLRAGFLFTIFIITAAVLIAMQTINSSSCEGRASLPMRTKTQHR